MLTGLGMTETAPFAICANGADVKSGHIGLPAPGMELKLVPSGDKLEVRYRGPNVTPGYWRAPEQTAESLRRRRLLLQRRRRCKLDRPGASRARLRCSTAASPRTSSSPPAPSSASARCARRSSPPATRCVQDVVVAGLNRNEIGILIFPRLDACRALRRPAGRRADAATCSAHAPVRAFFQRLVDRLHASGTGSATRVARALRAGRAAVASTAARSPTRARSTSARC